MHGSNKAMVRRAGTALVLGLALALTACGGGHSDGSGSVEQAPQSAEAVHAAFLTALRANNRAQVLALTVTDQQISRADEFLQRVRSYMDTTISSGPYATGGNLSDVQVIGIEDQGAAKHAWSRWQYAKKAICHETELTQTPAGWRVLEFYVPGSDARCTP